MILFKTAIRNFRKDPVMNVIGFVQLLAVFLVTTVMVSTISIRYRTYDSIKSILESRGFYAKFDDLDGAKKPGSGLYENMIYSVDELNSYTNADSVIAVQGAVVSGYLEKPDVNVSFPTALFYDDELLLRCKPVLKSGRWIAKNADKLEIVVAEHDQLNWKVGETYSLEIVQVDAPYVVIEAEIVGIVESSADIFGYNRDRVGNVDTFRFLYDTHNSHNIRGGHPDRPTIISSSEALARLYPEVNAHITSAFFIYDDTSDGLIVEKARLAGQLSAYVVDDLKYMNENSKVYLREELLTQMPVIVILLILLVISAISVSAIAARRRLKDYAKYYVLGLQWKQCALVSFFQALTTVTAALVVSAVVLFVIDFTPLSDIITVIVDMRLILALIGILLLYLAFSMIMPLIMLNSATPKQLLTTE